jgi:hypothetical protein
MTTWTTFETLDEMAQAHGGTTIYVDRLGLHGYVKDDRTRFQIVRGTQPEPERTDWVVWDLESEDTQADHHSGTMRECVQWLAGRVLYGA